MSERAALNVLFQAVKKRPLAVLIVAAVITLPLLWAASTMKTQLGYVHLLPSSDPAAAEKREIASRYSEEELVILLEGDRHAMVSAAEVLIPMLSELPGIASVRAEAPVDFERDHAFITLPAKRFERTLRLFADRGLVGAFRRLNDDLEYSFGMPDSTFAAERGERIESLFGVTRAVEILLANFAGRRDAPSVEEAADAWTFGEPWTLSLDRRTLMIKAVPRRGVTVDPEDVFATVEQVEQILDRLALQFPQVQSDVTGEAKILYDEQNSADMFSQLIFAAALLIVFIILALRYRSLMVPLAMALTVIVMILWALGLTRFFFDGVNRMAAMAVFPVMMLTVYNILHIVADRKSRASGDGPEPETAFNTEIRVWRRLIIADSVAAVFLFSFLLTGIPGLAEFGLTAGFGILLIPAVLYGVTVPLLVIRANRTVKRRAWRGKGRRRKTVRQSESSSRTSRLIASTTVWNHPAVFALPIFVLALGFIFFGGPRFRYDPAEVSPVTTESAVTFSAIPERFGFSLESFQVTAETLEQERELRKQLLQLQETAFVSSISNYLSDSEEQEERAKRLEDYRLELLRNPLPGWEDGDEERFPGELKRLNDNLVRLADRAVDVGDLATPAIAAVMSGYDPLNGSADSTALLPKYITMLERGVDEYRAADVAEMWGRRVTTNVYSMADPAPVEVTDLPENLRGVFLPKDGEKGYLLRLYTTDGFHDQEALAGFAAVVGAVSARITGRPLLHYHLVEQLRQLYSFRLLLFLIAPFVLLVVFSGGLRGTAALLPGVLTVPLTAGAIGVDAVGFLAFPTLFVFTIPVGVFLLAFARENGRAADSTGLRDLYLTQGARALAATLLLLFLFAPLVFPGFGSIAGFTRVMLPGLAVFCLVILLAFPWPMQLSMIHRHHKSGKTQHLNGDE